MIQEAIQITEEGKKKSAEQKGNAVKSNDKKIKHIANASTVSESKDILIINLRKDAPGITAVAGSLSWMTPDIKMESKLLIASHKDFKRNGKLTVNEYHEAVDIGMVALSRERSSLIYWEDFTTPSSLFVREQTWFAANEDMHFVGRTPVKLKNKAGKYTIDAIRLDNVTRLALSHNSEFSKYSLADGQNLLVDEENLAAWENGVKIEPFAIPGSWANRKLGGEGEFILQLSGPGTIFLSHANYHLHENKLDSSPINNTFRDILWSLLGLTLGIVLVTLITILLIQSNLN